MAQQDVQRVTAACAAIVVLPARSVKPPAPGSGHCRGARPARRLEVVNSIGARYVHDHVPLGGIQPRRPHALSLRGRRVTFAAVQPNLPAWKVFDAATPILTYDYSFGPGIARALVAGCPDGLVVVSPPCRVDAGVLDDLAQHGKVRALVASNAYHHLGIPEWKARFPDAAVFAPAQAIARVEKHTGLTGIRPLADAASLTGPRLTLVDMPHYKTGEVLVRADTDRGRVWYATDVIMNLPVLPKHPLVKAMFWASGSGPGLRYNNLAPLFMMKDKAAVRRWLADEFRKAPPQWLILAHGDNVDFTVSPDAARSLFGSS